MITLFTTVSGEPEPGQRAFAGFGYSFCNAGARSEAATQRTAWGGLAWLAWSGGHEYGALGGWAWLSEQAACHGLAAW
jgi:hypothetical protein